MLELNCEADDPQALKVIIFSKFCGQQIIIKHNKEGIFKLMVNESNGLSSCNASILYIAQLSGLFGESLMDFKKWLEWEAVYLQPLVYSFVAKGKKGLSEDLSNMLTYLVEERNTQGVVSHIDILLAASLHPAASDITLSALIWNSVPALKLWWNTVSNNEAIQLSLGVVCKDPVKVFDWIGKHQPTWTVPTVALSSLSLRSRPKSGDKKHENLEAMESMSESISSIASTGSLYFTSEEIEAAAEEFMTGRPTAPEYTHHPTPVLPVEGKRNVLITSALPYVNNVPHLGNIIGSTLSADVYARYCRCRGYVTLYVCGTDEYGTATETKALEEGVTPQEICDRYHKLHSEIYNWFNIGFDVFGRTTTEQQTKISQDIFWKLKNNDHLLEDTVEQQFCTNCTRFLADRFIEGTCPLCLYEDARGDQCDGCGKLLNATELLKPRCKVCKSTPELRTSKHLFLNLPKLEPRLKEWMSAVSSRWTHNCRAISNSWIKDGLKPRCITRDLKWGTPVPLDGYHSKVFYVWYDAPIGYLSITAKYTSQWEKWWKNPENVELYQFLGKDNVPFHSVIFPSCLIGTDEPYTMVNVISATEYINYEDDKFSKSRGVGVFGDQAQETGISADIWRFYLLYVRPEGQDTCFSWTDFQSKNNSELLNNFGNFVNRALTFLDKYYDKTIPAIHLDSDAKTIITQVRHELLDYLNLLERCQLRDAIKKILNISRLGNGYIQANKPWERVKSTDDNVKSACGTVMAVSANICCLLAALIQPYMPNMAHTLFTQMNAPEAARVLHPSFICYLPQGHVIGQPKPVVQKIEDATITEMKKKYEGKKLEKKPKKIATKQTDKSVDELNKAIETQGNLVRELKKNKSAKDVISAEVAVLLNLKQQLVTAQQQTPPTTDKSVDELNKAIETQGNAVRELKKNKAGKDVISAEVAVLLDLKQQLVTAQQQTPPTTNGVGGTGSPADVEDINKQITAQGLVVRELKASKSAKEVIGVEVTKLLELKAKLSALTGVPVDTGKGKKKGKK